MSPKSQPQVPPAVAEHADQQSALAQARYVSAAAVLGLVDAGDVEVARAVVDTLKREAVAARAQLALIRRAG